MPTVTLVNLGGPRTTEEIESFLRDLFLDPFIFDLPLPEPLRKALARFIAKKRAPKVAHAYSSMGFGGGSPLVAETQKQADALAEALSIATNKPWKGRVAMTCGAPNLRELPKDDLIPHSENIWIPLFPQFSRSTTLSLANIILEKTGLCPLGNQGWVDPFAEDLRFAEISAKLIHDAFTGNLSSTAFLHWNAIPPVGWEEMELVFSAHGIPMRLVKKGDVYVEEITKSVRNIETELRKKGFRGNVHISFQSRVGPAKWTEPNTKKTMVELGKRNARIAIYPISFLSDHLETLEEIGVELRDLALGAGAKEYFRIPSFGVYPGFVEYLQALALESVTKPRKNNCICLQKGGEALLKGCSKS
jgi:protoporphyrin/coproporphyrin ferrochelatase